LRGESESSLFGNESSRDKFDGEHPIAEEQPRTLIGERSLYDGDEVLWAQREEPSQLASAINVTIETAISSADVENDVNSLLLDEIAGQESVAHNTSLAMGGVRLLAHEYVLRAMIERKTNFAPPIESQLAEVRRAQEDRVELLHLISLQLELIRYRIARVLLLRLAGVSLKRQRSMAAHYDIAV
jgi:hypothetical protein